MYIYDIQSASAHPFIYGTPRLGDFDRQDSVDLVAATVVKGPAKVCKTSRMLGRARAKVSNHRHLPTHTYTTYM